MAILPVRVLPDPILRKEARPVENVDGAIQKLAADMIETMQAGYGAGLAGPQVGILKRIVTIQEPENKPCAMINPVITATAGERRVREGCLSVPGWFGMVTRAVTVTARALDTEGAEFEITDATELLAQAIEHEVDHLNGIMFTDHLQAHIDFWKVGEEPEVHEHPDIDFDHDAAHGKVFAVEERQELQDDEPEDEPDEADGDGPKSYAELPIYQQSDLDNLDAEMRRMHALMNGVATR